ncbi:MAG: sugar transferase [candidate division Zixibacteria bacterium]|nr:sugar transferase [candidate division Zixibacteria bacterium]
MPYIRRQNVAGKRLKPSHIASYSARIAYRRPWRNCRLLSVLRPGVVGTARRIKVLMGEYLLANLLLALLVVRTLLPVSLAAKVKGIDFAERLRFVFNWFCAVVLLAISLPLFFLIGLAIKLDSTGPVFFAQQRVGVNRRRRQRRQNGDSFLDSCRNGDRRRENLYGKPFTVYKFRTMVIDAEKRCGPIWATKNDPRVTKVGQLLRKTRLDELPQLFNVLKCEMSIVGPRPERPFFVCKLAQQIKDYTRRLEVKPGITGLAQVENGYDSSVDDVKKKVGCDLTYIMSFGIKRDLLIMIRTVGVILGFRGI